ncbi:MAG: magnesium transporter [Planctomycetes bacterium]|nr:magnesium transporter [Planctomycetota bacterium]
MARVRRREIRQQVLGALRAHLEGGPDAPFTPQETVHPADLADVLWLDMAGDDAVAVFSSLSPELAAEVLAEAEPQLIEKVLAGMPSEQIGALLSEVPADDGTDILEVLSEGRRQEVLSFVEPEEAVDLRHLGAYEADTAGGLMTTEFVTVVSSEKVGDVLKRLKRGDEEDAETINTLYLVDAMGMLKGVISTRELLAANIHEDVVDAANPDVILSRTDEDQEEIARRILHYNLSAIPVVDPRGVLVGIITSDDALEVLEDEGSEDALLLAGASGDSEAVESVWKKVGHRAPMLLVTVLAGLLMARVMKHFAPGLDQVAEGKSDWVTILTYIPMVLALAGTIGTQTSAILVRGFAVGQVRPGRRMKVFFGEVQVGVVLGTLTCLIAIPAAAWLSQDLRMGISLGLALLLAMSWAATAATSIALGSEAAGLDPALVSGPVMMAVSDLSAVLLFFGVAQALLAAS